MPGDGAGGPFGVGFADEDGCGGDHFSRGPALPYRQLVADLRGAIEEKSRYEGSGRYGGASSRLVAMGLIRAYQSW